MNASLWNIGVKVEDLEKEMEFFEALGAEVLMHERGKPHFWRLAGLASF